MGRIVPAAQHGRESEMPLCMYHRSSDGVLFDYEEEELRRMDIRTL